MLVSFYYFRKVGGSDSFFIENNKWEGHDKLKWMEMLPKLDFTLYPLLLEA